MNGKNVKYQYDKKTSRSFITIPRSMAEGLKWKKGDDINITMEVINEKKGLFLYKKEK